LEIADVDKEKQQLCIQFALFSAYKFKLQVTLAQSFWQHGLKLLLTQK